MLIGVHSAIQILLYPQAATLGKEDGPLPFSLTDNLSLTASGVELVALDAQGLGDAHTGGQQQFNEGPKPQAGERIETNGVEYSLDLAVVQILDLRCGPLGQLDLCRIQARNAQSSPAKFQEALE